MSGKALLLRGRGSISNNYNNTCLEYNFLVGGVNYQELYYLFTVHIFEVEGLVSKNYINRLQFNFIRLNKQCQFF